jgi:hypothetical protein
MRRIKSPGAVAAHGAFEADRLGRQVVSEITRQQQFPQAPIRATLIGSDRCDDEGVSARGYSQYLTCVVLCWRLVITPPLLLKLGAARHSACTFARLVRPRGFTVTDDRHGTPRLRSRQEGPQGYVTGLPVAPIADPRGVATPEQPATLEAAT